MILRHYAFFIFRMADKAGLEQTKDAVINKGIPMFIECIESGTDKYPGGPDLISPFKWEDVQADWNDMSDDEKEADMEDIATLIDGCWRDLEFAYYTNHDRNAFKFILGDYYRIHQINENYVSTEELEAQLATESGIALMSLDDDANAKPVQTGIATRKPRVDYYGLNLS